MDFSVVVIILVILICLTAAMFIVQLIGLMVTLPQTSPLANFTYFNSSMSGKTLVNDNALSATILSNWSQLLYSGSQGLVFQQDVINLVDLTNQQIASFEAENGTPFNAGTNGFMQNLFLVIGMLRQYGWDVNFEQKYNSLIAS